MFIQLTESISVKLEDIQRVDSVTATESLIYLAGRLDPIDTNIPKPILMQFISIHEARERQEETESGDRLARTLTVNSQRFEG